uniref:DUF2192 domain-containing protein n=1 Tax=Staphylothermus marinus TaxID=2280 RepID=A0A7C4JMJ6_STAMA
MSRNIYVLKLKIASEILNKSVKRKDLSRAKLVKILKALYRKYRVKPFKGKANPQDLYDKELTTLYVIGKYGLNLDQEYPDFFENVFYIERVLDTCIDMIMRGEYERARELLRTISPSNVVDSNTIAKLLRLPFTKHIFGFIDEETFAKILIKTKEAFPEEDVSVRNYVRFYIAFRVAEAISKGLVKDPGFKEALKKSIGLRIGFPKTIPSDKYIRVIAKEVFGVKNDFLDKVLVKISGKTESIEKKDSPKSIEKK